MGRMEFPAEMPDVYGLPEYRCSEMQMEMAGGDIRMVFGDRRFGQIQWLYTAVVAPEKLMMFCQAAGAMAEEAYNIMQMMDRRQNGKRGH